MKQKESPLIFGILLCAAILFASFVLTDVVPESVTKAVQSRSAGYTAYGEVTAAASLGSSGFSVQDDAPTRKRFILIGVDGMQYDHYVTMLGFGNLSNFTRLLQRAGFNTTHNITGHTTPSTAPGWAEFLTGLNSGLTGVTDNTCSNPVPNGNTTFERLEQFNSSIVTGLISGKETCYIPDGVLGNAKADINHFFNRSNYNNTDWTDGTACAFDRNVSTKAREFIINYTNESFFLLAYFGTPDCSGHVGSDNSANYNSSFIEVNHALGILLDTLRDQSIENTTAVLLITDHGWNEGTTGHSTFNSDTAIIPLITNNRSIINNASTDGSREQCDVAPTILDYFGMPATDYGDIIGNNCSSMYDASYSINIGGSACAVINTSYFLIGNVLSNTSCFVLNASNITFNCAGFTVTGNATGDGIAVPANQVNVTIKDCTVRNFDRGIRFTSVNNSVIQNSSGLNATTDGLSLGSSHFNIIANSTGFGSGGAGIRLETSMFNNLTNVSGNSDSASGVLLDSSTNTTVRDSRANSTSGTAAWYVFASGTSQILNTTGASEGGNGIRIDSGGAVLVANSTGRSNNGAGILLSSADYTLLIDSTGASNTSTGISLGTNTNATNVTGISNTSQGIIISGATGVVVRNSRASSNSSTGLFFSSSTGSTAINVTATSVTATAITIGSGTANTLINSSGTSTSSNGLLIEFSTYNNLSGNTFSNNNIGVLLTGAVAGSAATNNTIAGGTIAGNVIGIGLNGYAEENLLENMTLSSNSRAGIQINESALRNVIRNVTFAGNLFGILFAGGENNTVLNSTVNGTRGAINVTLNGHSGYNNSINNSQLVMNATFEFTSNITGPTILVFPAQLNFTSLVRFRDVLNVSNNRLFVNGSIAALNHTAHIIMHNTFIEPNVTYDPEDDGTFGACPASICTMLSQSSGRIHFSVSGFTAYGSNETGPLNISNTTVVSNATFNGSRNSTLSGIIGDAFGFAVGAGDFNNDTVKDHVFGAPFVPDNLAITATGKVYVVYGQNPFTPGMNVTEVTANITIRGPTNNGSAQLGRAVSAGDLNGDLIDDLVYAVPGIHQVGVLFGANGLGNVRPRFNETNISINASSLIDISLAVADFNNDSFQDLAIGQPDFSIFDNEVNATFQGRVDVLYGRASWPSFVNLSQDANVTLTGTVAGDRFGFSVAAGDVNGDGIKDLVASAPRRNVSGVAGVGTVYAFFGGALFMSEPALVADTIMEGESVAFGVTQVNASTGFALFANGDVNNDSVADILVGAPNLAVDSPTEYDAGATYVVFGRSSLAGTFNLSAANATMYGAFGSASPGGIPGGERSGFALFARDVTNDSTDDVFIGAPMADTNGVADAGLVYLVYGLQSWPRFLNLTQANRSFADLVQNSSFGWSLANGSVLVGAPDLDAQRSPVTGLFELSSGNAFPGLSIGHAYDIGSPGAPDTTTTISTTTTTTSATTTTTLPSGSGGGSGGGSTGGGSRGVFYSCRSNQNGETGAQFFGIEAGLGQWRNCEDYSFWNTFTAGETYLGGKVTEAYTTCCECTTKKRCDHVKGAVVVEEVPKPPCRGLIKSFPCGEQVGTFTPGSGFPYKPTDIQQDLDKCCSCEEMAKYFGGCDDTPTPPGGVNVQEFAAAHQRYKEKCCQQPTYCPLPEMECYPKVAPFQGVEFRWYWPPNECPEHSVQIPCESIDDAGALGSLAGQAPGLFSDADIAAGAEQCCKKKVCPKKPYSITNERCKTPAMPAVVQEFTDNYGVKLPECTYILLGSVIDKETPCTVQKPKNNCWKREPICKEGSAALGTSFAFCDKEDTFMGDKRCQAAAPTADDAFQSGTQAQNGCAVQFAPTAPGPASNILFTFEADCDKDCQLQCPPCLPGNLMQLFQSLVPFPLWIGPTNTGPFLPMNLIKCASETIVPPEIICMPGSTDPACILPAPACEPGSTDPACTTPQPCPPGSSDPACSSPVPDDCAAKGSCPQPCRSPPCGSIEVDSPTPFPTPTPEPISREVPAPTPLETVQDTPPLVYCAAASPAGGESVTLAQAGAVDSARIPPGYEVIASVGVQCAGKALDVTLNIPDNFKDVRSFLMTPDDAESLPSELAQAPQCGGAWAQQIRQQQGAESAYGVDYRELTSITEKAAIISPSADQRWVQSGAYRVEFINPAREGVVSVRLSAPPFDVPAPEQISLVIIGTPLWLHVDQLVLGSVRVTLPFSIPEHVDPASATIAVMIDGRWVPLTTEINALEATATAMLDDIAPALNADGNALFAVMGLYCASCLDVVLEKVYDGGSRKAVLLIPGFTTDRFRFQLFIDDLVRANSDWQVWIANYPTSMPSADVAREISAQLEQHAAEFNTMSMVTHSVGGFSAQRALEEARVRGFAWQRKAQDVIMAGQPGLGSPAEAYRELFNVLVNLKTTSSLFSKSALLTEATDGLQVVRAPNVEYFIIAGRQTYPFTASLFKDASGTYQPNDGIVSIYSARTVGGEQITDTCRHYFEVPRTHTDLFDDWLPRRVMQRALFRNDALQRPDDAIAGYNAFVHVSDPDCQPGTLVVVGKRIPDAATADPLLCNCGNGVCGEGENELNCPQDCATGYKYTYLCRVLPWIIGPMIALLLLLTAVYVYGAERRHERGEGVFWISALASVIFLLIVGLYVFCGFTTPLGVLVFAFVVALLAFTVGHLRTAGRREPIIDDSSAKKLEELLRRARLP